MQWTGAVGRLDNQVSAGYAMSGPVLRAGRSCVPCNLALLTWQSFCGPCFLGANAPQHRIAPRAGYIA